EDASGFALRARVRPGSGDRHHRVVLPALDRFVGRLHPFEHLAEDERLAVTGQRQVNAVDVGEAPDVAVVQTTQNRVICLLLGESAARALLAVLAVMAHPGLAEHLPAETAVPVLAVPGVLSVSLVRLEVERMRG